MKRRKRLARRRLIRELLRKLPPPSKEHSELVIVVRIAEALLRDPNRERVANLVADTARLEAKRATLAIPA